MFLLLLRVPAGAQQQAGTINGLGELYRVEFEYRNWDASLITELEVGPDSTNVSLSEDLGVPDERIHHFMGAVRIVSWLKARGSYLKREYAATVMIRRDLTIDGTTIPALTNVDTDQTLEYVTIGAEGDLYASEYFVFSAVGDYTRFRTDTRLLASNGSLVDLGQRELGLLTLGLKLRIYLTPNFAVTGEASGMKKDGSGVLTNLDGLATYSFNRNFAVSFGYQHRYARIDQGDREIYRLKGSYFGATVRF
jgi:hypothetical protein